MTKQKSSAAQRKLKFHLDKRAAALAATIPNNDDLLTTEQLAALLGVSTQWLEIRRCKGGGPEYESLSPRVIRYTRGKVKKWLRQRSHKWTKEYV
jgi:hypothetical protein